MEIDKFISDWIDGQCRRFASDIQETEDMLTWLNLPIDYVTDEE